MDSSAADSLDAQLLLLVPDTQCFLIKEEKSELLESGDLELLLSQSSNQVPAPSVYMLSIDRFCVALSRNVPCLQVADRSFIFPAEGFCYGIVLSASTPQDSLDVLLTILDENTAFRSSAPLIVPQNDAPSLSAGPAPIPLPPPLNMNVPLMSPSPAALPSIDSSPAAAHATPPSNVSNHSASLSSVSAASDPALVLELHPGLKPFINTVAHAFHITNGQRRWLDSGTWTLSFEVPPPPSAGASGPSRLSRWLPSVGWRPFGAKSPDPAAAGLGPAAVDAPAVAPEPSLAASHNESGTVTLTAYGTLPPKEQLPSQSASQEAGPRLWLHVGAVKIPLRATSVVITVAPANFVFIVPQSASSSGVEETFGIAFNPQTLSEAEQGTLTEAFESVLQVHCIHRKARAAKPILAMPLIEDSHVELGRRVSVGLQSGSSAVVSGIAAGTALLGAGILRGASYLQTRMAQAPQPVEIAPATRSRLEQARWLSGKAVKVSKSAVTAAMAASTALSTRLVEAIQGPAAASPSTAPSTATAVVSSSSPSPVGPSATAAVIPAPGETASSAVPPVSITPTPKTHTAKRVAKASIDAVLTVWQAVEDAGVTLLHTMKTATVQVVNHKYGPDAAKSTADGLSVVTDLSTAAVHFRRAGLRSIVGRTASYAVQDMLSDAEERELARQQRTHLNLSLPQQMQAAQVAMAIDSFADTIQTSAGPAGQATATQPPGPVNNAIAAPLAAHQLQNGPASVLVAAHPFGQPQQNGPAPMDADPALASSAHPTTSAPPSSTSALERLD